MEIYLGSEEDRQYIKTYLANIRQLDPIEIATLPNPITLANPLLEEVIDLNQFWGIVSQSLDECEKRYGIRLNLLKPERYYTSQPVEDNDIGGFYSPHSLGYQYWYHGAFVIMLSNKVASRKLRTLEFARDFLHDCFHFSTFVSFRRVLRTPAKSPADAKHCVPEVYREQYGINFRNEEGLSYSAKTLTAYSPETINLNLLMDGVIVLTVAELMRQTSGDVAKNMNALEEEIRKEIFLEPFDIAMFPRAHGFHNAVTDPSRIFVEHWGGMNLVTLVLQAMMNGNLQPLKDFFEKKVGTSNAWEKKFRRSGFSIVAEPEF